MADGRAPCARKVGDDRQGDSPGDIFVLTPSMKQSPSSRHKPPVRWLENLLVMDDVPCFAAPSDDFKIDSLCSVWANGSRRNPTHACDLWVHVHHRKGLPVSGHRVRFALLQSRPLVCCTPRPQPDAVGHIVDVS